MSDSIIRVEPEVGDTVRITYVSAYTDNEKSRTGELLALETNRERTYHHFLVREDESTLIVASVKPAKNTVGSVNYDDDGFETSDFVGDEEAWTLTYSGDITRKVSLGRLVEVAVADPHDAP